MKNSLHFLLILGLWLTAAVVARGQGTVFTYQGRLTDTGNAYTGSAEFQATLWSVASGGTALASNSPIIVSVTNGLFVLPLNFGANFSGADRWLQLEVRTAIGPFNLLTPRQQITPTPYAITASNLSGLLPAGQLSGPLASTNLAGAYSSVLTLNNAANSFSGSGAGLTALNASQLTSGTVPDARLASNVARTNQVWLRGGNAGTTAGTHFLGTTDNQALELKVNGLRALRLENNGDSDDGDSLPDGAPNVIGGSPRNFVAAGVVGAVIAGGGVTNYGGLAHTNSVSANFGVIGGGDDNVIQTGGGYSIIGGGSDNTINGAHSAIGGGFANRILTGASRSTIGGGSGNTIQTNADYATIPGGYNNSAAANYAFAAGRQAKANHTGTFVWGDSQAVNVSSTGTNQFLIRAAGGVGIGTESPNSQLHVNGDGVDPSLRVQVSGTSKLVVNANGGTAIGANTTPPANGLYVLGDVGIGRIPAANSLEVAGDASKSIAGNWLANSDARIKTGVHNVTHALEKLARVRPVEFRYTEEYRAQHPGIEDRPYLNVIAQEFQKVFPEAVKSSGDKLPNGEPILQVDTYPLTIYSAAAIKELNQKVEEKNTRIAELERRLEKLERLIRQK
jgi:hypothetical protein